MESTGREEEYLLYNCASNGAIKQGGVYFIDIIVVK